MTEDEPVPIEPSTKVDNESERLSKKGVVWFLIVQCIVLVVVFVSLLNMGSYRFSLFCVIPFSIGLTVGVYTKLYKTKKFLKGSSITVAIICGICFLLIAIGLEGAMCVVMALGIFFLPAMLGMLIGYWIRNIHRIYIVLLILMLNSSFITYDYLDDSTVRSTATEYVTIHASKERIWNVLTHGVQFHPNTNMFFRSGVNYPTSMQLKYTSSSKCYLVCTLNMGNASLEVDQLDSLERIRFKVPEEIKSMKELTMYDSIDAPHLKGYFKPSFGEFRIEEVDASECRLIATTSYSYKITPAFYWEWWTDYLVNTMHNQVLNDIKTLAEGK